MHSGCRGIGGDRGPPSGQAASVFFSAPTAKLEFVRPSSDFVLGDLDPIDWRLPAAQFESLACEVPLERLLSRLGLQDGLTSSRFTVADGGTATSVLPRIRSAGANAEPVEAVRSYGRGYVQPGVVLKTRDGAVRGLLAVKGSGVEGWARDNADWVRQENGHRDVELGRVGTADLLRDLAGEMRCLVAGVSAPPTVAVSGRPGQYRVARLWRCPYRIWELTSSCFRRGPLATQSALLLNWQVELVFALAHREPLSARARSVIGVSDPAGEPSPAAAAGPAVAAAIARLCACDYQLAPYAFHLANIAYSGETSGYDRIMAPARCPGTAARGVITALVESWLAIAWLQAVVGAPRYSLDCHYAAFLAALRTCAAGTRTRNRYDAARGLAGVAADLPPVAADDPLLTGLPLSRRRPGDFEQWIDAADTLIDGLRAIYSGAIDTLSDLRRWQERADFDRCEDIRHEQAFGGPPEPHVRDRYRARLQEHRQLARGFAATCGLE